MCEGFTFFFLFLYTRESLVSIYLKYCLKSENVYKILFQKIFLRLCKLCKVVFISEQKLHILGQR